MRHLIECVKRTVWLAVTACMLVACDDREAALEQLVPADACGVARIDVSSILNKAGLVDDDDEVALDDDLLDRITINDDNLAARLVGLCASGGIDVETPVYLYFDNRNKPVALLAVDDENVLIEAVEEATGKNFVVDNKHDVKHLRDKNYSYSLQERVLLLRYVLADVPYEADQPANYYTSLKTSQGLLEKNEELSDFLHGDGDVNIYLAAKCVDEIMPAELGSVGLVAMSLFKGHDFDALRITLNFDSENSLATMQTTIDASEESAYVKFMSQLLLAPSTDFLEVVPASMETVVGMSVNGSVLAASPQLAALQETYHLSHAGALNLSALLATVHGPMIMAGAHDPYTDENNVIFAARSNDPQMLLDSVAAYASLQGQDPMHSWRGDLIYDYGMRQMTVGVRDSIFFVKAMTYDDSEEDKLTNLPDVSDLFAHSSVGIYGQARLDGQLVGIYTYGLKDTRHGNGLFYTVNDSDNVTLMMLKLLCSIAPAPATPQADAKAPADA